MEIKKIFKEEVIKKEFISIEMDIIDAKDICIVVGDVIRKLKENEQESEQSTIESQRTSYNLATLYKLYTPLEIHFHKMNKQR